MVNNKMKILDDGGKIKYVPEVKEMVKWYNTDSLYFKFALSDKKTDVRHALDADLNEITIECENENYVEPSRKFIAWKKKCFVEGHLGGLIPNDNYRFSADAYKECAQKFWTRKEILDYLKIIPFTPSVMINISPNWGDKCRGKRIQCLKQIIDNYMSEGWYDKWSYVIECGSEGTHIHAHIVAHMNVTRLKSCESHVGHNNQRRQLQKWAAKIEGMKGLIEGVSVQSTILRNETLVSDKLDYLIESKKPEGHKNHHVIQNGYVEGVL